MRSMFFGKPLGAVARNHNLFRHSSAACIPNGAKSWFYHFRLPTFFSNSHHPIVVDLCMDLLFDRFETQKAKVIHDLNGFNLIYVSRTLDQK